MIEPQYQELLKKDVPHVSVEGVHVAVIAGTSYGTSVSHMILPLGHMTLPLEKMGHITYPIPLMELSEKDS